MKLKTLILTGTLLTSLNAVANCELEVQSDWQSGFLAKIHYQNSSNQTLNDWSFNIDYQNTQITSFWGDANWNYQTPTTVTPLSWKTFLNPGESGTVYFVANRNGQAEDAILSGGPCGEADDSGVIFSESFETDSVLDLQQNWSFLGNWWSGISDEENINRMFDISNNAKSGAKSLLVNKAAQDVSSFIYRELPENIENVYVRFWINPSENIGKNTSLIGRNYIFAMGDDAGTDGSFSNINIGQIHSTGLRPLIADTDQHFPSLNPNIELLANQWSCVEFSIQGDSQLEFSVNEQLISSTEIPSWVGERKGFVFFGQHLISGFVGIQYLFDDIVVSTSPVGCN